MPNELRSFLERLEEIFGLTKPSARAEALRQLDGRILNQAAQGLIAQLSGAQQKQYQELVKQSKSAPELGDFLFRAFPPETVAQSFAKATQTVVAEHVKTKLAQATPEQEEKFTAMLPEFAAHLKPHVAKP